MDHTLKNKIKEIAKSRAEQYVQWRRHLHKHPELSFQEENTASYIRELLTERNIKFEKDYSLHATVATIGSSSSKSLALRADIDALPITEANEHSYKSINEGVMHACGHDVHTTCLLGAIDVLNDLDIEWEGQIEAIFQPAEEKLPGGASVLIKEGLFSKHNVATVIGQHVHPPLEAGKLGFCEGEYMASADEIYIDVIGKGGHAATPQYNIDPVLVSASILQNLQQVVSRYSNPLDPTVLSFGKINSVGGATNIIPDVVRLEGTLRTMNEEWRSKAHGLIKSICHETASGLGAKVNCDIKIGYPSLVNDIDLTRRMKNYAQEYLGKENVVNLPKRLAAEDFAFYSQQKPACFYRLGTGNVSRGITSSVHTTTFDIDESAIEIGVGFMAYQAIRQLNEMK